MNKKMAKALIDTHNALPSGINEIMTEMPSDAEPFEYLELQFSNLLVELWEIQNRFPHGSLEKVVWRKQWR